MKSFGKKYLIGILVANPGQPPNFPDWEEMIRGSNYYRQIVYEQNFWNQKAEG